MSQKPESKNTGDKFRDAMFSEHVGDASREVTEQALKAIAVNIENASKVNLAMALHFKGWPEIPAEKSHTSLAAICRESYCSPVLVRQVCELHQIEPTLLIDNTPFFSGEATEVIREAVRRILSLRDREAEEKQREAQGQVN